MLVGAWALFCLAHPVALGCGLAVTRGRGAWILIVPRNPGCFNLPGLWAGPLAGRPLHHWLFKSGSAPNRVYAPESRGVRVVLAGGVQSDGHKVPPPSHAPKARMTFFSHGCRQSTNVTWPTTKREALASGSPTALNCPFRRLLLVLGVGRADLRPAP